MLASETFQEAKKIVTFEGWTKGAAARNSLGFSTGVGDPEAVSFCMIGAMERAAGGTYDMECEIYLRQCMPFGQDVPVFNDRSDTYLEDVVRVFDRATILAKEDGN